METFPFLGKMISTCYSGNFDHFIRLALNSLIADLLAIFSCPVLYTFFNIGQIILINNELQNHKLRLLLANLIFKGNQQHASFLNICLQQLKYQLMKKIQLGLVEQQLLGKSSSIEELINQTNKARSTIIEAVNKGEIQSASHTKQKYIAAIYELKSMGQKILVVAELAIQYFYFQIAVSGELQDQIQKQLLKKCDKLPKIDQVWNQLKSSIILSTSLLQLSLKKTIHNRTSSSSDLLAIQRFIRELVSIHHITKRYSKHLITIISHLRLYQLNIKCNHQKKIVDICEALLRDQSSQIRLLTIETKVVLLYNCLKTLLGVRNFTQLEDNALSKLYEKLRVKTVSRYHQHLLHLFFIIKALIFRKGQALEGNQDAISSEEEDQEFLQSAAAEKLSNWTSVSLDQTYLALQEAERSIVRHRVASLATVIGLKLGLPRFCLNFLELMHDGPFNDQSQTIKLCFQLFEAREYQRLKACLQAVLSSPSCKNLRQREVLISMCAIFQGVFLGDRQGALIYAKLNHHQNKRLILRQQTLLQHVGFAYLNLASHEPYICNRQVFQQQALAVLRQSAKVNPHNYLTQYCLGKLLLTMGDAQKAYEHTKQSIMSGRGEWVPYSLLACIYFCQRKISKALTLIEELTKKYKGIKNLFYIKAYLEVNRLLLEVEHDEQVEAAKELGQQIYELTRDRILKSKSPQNLLKYCQQYHQASLGIAISQFDDKYFYNVPVLNVQGGMIQTFVVGYQQVEGEKTILQIIPLLVQAGQINLAQILIKGLPTSPLKTYKQALLHEIKKQKEQAISMYKLLLSQEPYHTPSLINLSLLSEDIGDALHYLQLAQKFVSNSQLWLAKGIIMSKFGRITQANEYLIREGQTGWLQYQPELLYYY